MNRNFMTTLTVILVHVPILLFQSCGFHSSKPPTRNPDVPRLDDSTGTVLVANEPLGHHLLGSQGYIYFDSVNIDYVDADSFVVLNKNFAADKNFIYYKNSLFVPEDGFDRDSFSVIDDNYARDKSHVYYGNSAIRKADPTSFEVISEGLAKDKWHVVVKGTSTVMDPKSFRQVAANFFTDDKYVYYGSSLLKVQATDFKYLSYRYWTDGKNVYNGHQSLNIDPADLVILTSQLHYDGSEVKSLNTTDSLGLSTLDHTSFIVLSKLYSHNANSIIFSNKLMVSESSGINPVDIELLDEEYLSYKNKLYYLGKLVDDNSTGKNFTRLKYDYVKTDSGYFYRGVKVDSRVDVALKWQSPAYASIGDNLYYNGVKLENFDLASLVMLGGHIVKDSAKAYQGSEQVLQDLDVSNLRRVSLNFLTDDKLVFKNPPNSLPLTPGIVSENFEILEDSWERQLFRLNGHVFAATDLRSSLQSLNEHSHYLGRGYFSDATGISYMGDYISNLESNSAGDFEVLSHYYVRFGNQVFMGPDELIGAQGVEFRVVGGYFSWYGRDSLHAFYTNEVITGADAETFEILSLGFQLSFDKKSFYQTSNELAGIDPSDLLHFPGNYYIASGNHVYYRDKLVSELDGHSLKLVGSPAQPYFMDNTGTVAYRENVLLNIDGRESYFIPDNSLHFITDGNVMYRGNKEIQGVDIKSFENLGRSYYRDNNIVFYGSNITPIEGSDPGSFTLGSKSFYYASDKNQIYYLGKVIAGGNTTDFIILDKKFAKDDTQVFYQGLIIGGALPDSFEIIDSRYQKDNESVYYRGVKIDSARPANFVILGSDYGKDDLRIYFQGSDLSAIHLDVDVPSFQVLATNLYKDNSAYYYEENKLNLIFSEVIELIGKSKLVGLKDSSNVYNLMGIHLTNMNATTTFSMTKSNYLLFDDNSIYYLGEKIENVDRDSFSLLSSAIFSKDKNRCYSRGISVDRNLCNGYSIVESLF